MNILQSISDIQTEETANIVDTSNYTFITKKSFVFQNRYKRTASIEFTKEGISISLKNELDDVLEQWDDIEEAQKSKWFPLYCDLNTSIRKLIKKKFFEKAKSYKDEKMVSSYLLELTKIIPLEDFLLKYGN